MRISTTLNQVLLAGSACVAAFLSPQANAANLILNGGFEGGGSTCGRKVRANMKGRAEAAFMAFVGKRAYAAIGRLRLT
jgi:hypothetical protein